MLLASINKHLPMLQRAGCKPAFHLVAHYHMDREHSARPIHKHRPLLQRARVKCCAFPRKPYQRVLVVAPDHSAMRRRVPAVVPAGRAFGS
jgi:hypothetical protein